MTALTAAYEAERQDGILIDVPVLASAVIYKGALVGDDGTGFAEPVTDASTTFFLGVAAEGATGGTADGDVTVRVYKTGTFIYTKTGGAADTDLGIAAMANDDATVAATSTNSVQVGTIVKIVDATRVKVRVDNFTL